MDRGRLEQVFKAFEKAASSGARCPTADDLPPRSPRFARELASLGLIRIEISGKNWRQVHILTGPAAGKATAPNPDGHYAWRIIAKEDLINGQPHQRRSHRHD